MNNLFFNPFELEDEYYEFSPNLVFMCNDNKFFIKINKENSFFDTVIKGKYNPKNDMYWMLTIGMVVVFSILIFLFLTLTYSKYEVLSLIPLLLFIIYQYLNLRSERNSLKTLYKARYQSNSNEPTPKNNYHHFSVKSFILIYTNDLSNVERGLYVYDENKIEELTNEIIAFSKIQGDIKVIPGYINENNVILPLFPLNLYFTNKSPKKDYMSIFWSMVIENLNLSKIEGWHFFSNDLVITNPKYYQKFKLNHYKGYLNKGYYLK